MTGYGKLLLDHYAESPVVYLDHGPLMEIAANHADAFVDALISRNGTLAFSWVNLVERARVADDTAAVIDRLLRRLWPRLIFLEAVPDVVIDREDSLLAGVSTRPPHLDDPLVRMLMTNPTPGCLNPIDPEGLLTVYRTPEVRAACDTKWEATTEMIMGAVAASADRYREDEAIRARFRLLPGQTPIEFPTRYVYDEGIRYLIKNDLAHPNHAADLFHMVVPVSFCDYVVLDANWKEAARQVQNKLRDAELLTHEAKVYRVSEIGEFITQLKSGNT